MVSELPDTEHEQLTPSCHRRCCSADFRRAAEEVAACLRRIYADADKALQAALFADAMLTIQLCDTCGDVCAQILWL